MTNPLPSWKDTETRQAILGFVAAIADESSPDYVPPVERIAVFDNDGTLWCERPMYIQLDYILRALSAQAEQEPSLRRKQPWQAAYEKDYAWFGDVMTKHYSGDDTGLKALLGGVLSLSDGRLVEQIEAEAQAFVEKESHPTLGIPYRRCIYQPMVELLRYLEANDFIVYIVSGGGRDFMRGTAPALYGVPRERIIGSTVAYDYVENADGDAIVQKAALDVIDDGPSKPVQIWNVTGRRPILAAGNSNGDLPMLKFAGGPAHGALRLLIVHDDGQREFDYMAGAEVVYQAVKDNGWLAVSMKDDWEKIFVDAG